MKSKSNPTAQPKTKAAQPNLNSPKQESPACAINEVGLPTVMPAQSRSIGQDQSRRCLGAKCAAFFESQRQPLGMADHWAAFDSIYALSDRRNKELLAWVDRRQVFEDKFGVKAALNPKKMDELTLEFMRELESNRPADGTLLLQIYDAWIRGLYDVSVGLPTKFDFVNLLARRGITFIERTQFPYDFWKYVEPAGSDLLLLSDSMEGIPGRLEKRILGVFEFAVSEYVATKRPNIAFHLRPGRIAFEEHLSAYDTYAALSKEFGDEYPLDWDSVDAELGQVQSADKAAQDEVSDWFRELSGDALRKRVQKCEAVFLEFAVNRIDQLYSIANHWWIEEGRRLAGLPDSTNTDGEREYRTGAMNRRIERHAFAYAKQHAKTADQFRRETIYQDFVNSLLEVHPKLSERVHYPDFANWKKAAPTINALRVKAEAHCRAELASKR